MNIKSQSGNSQFEEDAFGKGARGISKYYHEVLF